MSAVTRARCAGSNQRDSVRMMGAQPVACAQPLRAQRATSQGSAPPREPKTRLRSADATSPTATSRRGDRRSPRGPFTSWPAA